MKRIREDPKVRKIAEDARVFQELSENPAWLRLWERMDTDRERFLLGISRRMMAGEVVPQREIDFHRGFYFGVEYVKGVPTHAMESLETAARRAWRQALREELEDTSPEESPYT